MPDLCFGGGTMRKIFLAMLGSAAITCGAAGSAKAVIMVVDPLPPPISATNWLGGTEQFGDFINIGDTLESTFTVPSSTTDYLDMSQLNPTGDLLQVETWNSANTVNSSSLNSLALSRVANVIGILTGSYNVYVTLEAAAAAVDPFGGFELVSNGPIDLALPSATPLPAALPLFAGGLGLIGFSRGA